MKNKLISFKLPSIILLAVLLSLVVLPVSKAQAKVLEYSDMYLELSIPDDTIVLTQDSPDTDEHWITAGITNVKSEKETMKKMGVKALLFDPETKALVRMLQKQSNQASDIFNLSLLSDEKKAKFFDELVGLDDENAKATIEEVSHPDAVFFRYNIEVIKDGNTMTELIYSTIVNGSTISFDIFQNTNSVPINETFIKELVEGTHFTKFLDKTEVEQEMKNSIIRLLVEVLLVIVVIIIWLIIRKKRLQKQKLVKDDKAGALTRFYTARKNKGDDAKDEVRFINRTKYSKEVMKDFCYYNRFLKRINMWVISALFFILILYFLYTSSTGILGVVIASLLMLVFVYYQGISVEKLVVSMMKMYDNSKGTEAVFTFYDDYFTLSGIQYISTYPYLQITEVKQHKDFIYIYTGPDKAFYLKKDGFEGGYETFLNFLENGIKDSKNQ
ncbi:MAG: hypothetical protein K0S61_1918 [Anaerocolumna sp.]|jgi:hypothetical protein|nr:hypothetical protein [Anaerocolumna sp.]